MENSETDKAADLSEAGADGAADMSDDGRWLTYDQFAKLSRIDRPSAIRLATRQKWRRRKNNVGPMTVCVPLPWLERAEARQDRYRNMSAERSASISAFDAALAAVREATAGEVAAWKGRAEAAETLADAEREARQAAEARADKAEAMAEQARIEAKAAHTTRREAEERVQRLRAVDAARRARGLPARILAAIRGA